MASIPPLRKCFLPAAIRITLREQTPTGPNQQLFKGAFQPDLSPKGPLRRQMSKLPQQMHAHRTSLPSSTRKKWLWLRSRAWGVECIYSATARP